MSHTQDINTTISTYYESAWKSNQIRPTDVNTCLKKAVVTLNLERYGFTKDLVSSHSLRAGGATAMFLNSIGPTTIKKQGRWSSNTFMIYINEQIGALTIGLSTAMSKCIPYCNMGPPNIHPQVTDPDDPVLTTPK